MSCAVGYEANWFCSSDMDFSGVVVNKFIKKKTFNSERVKSCLKMTFLSTKFAEKYRVWVWLILVFDAYFICKSFYI